VTTRMDWPIGDSRPLHDVTLAVSEGSHFMVGSFPLNVQYSYLLAAQNQPIAGLTHN
jgi:hypothetical protein